MDRTPTKHREMESIFNAPKKQKREPYLFDNAPVADLNANALTEELEFNIIKHKNQDGTYQDYDVVEGSEDPISIQEIKDGDTIGIVDKGNAHEKIYIYSNLAEIFFNNTTNPFTREEVYRIDVYKAHIVPESKTGGKKYKKTQKTKKNKRSNKNTKKHSKK